MGVSQSYFNTKLVAAEWNKKISLIKKITKYVLNQGLLLIVIKNLWYTRISLIVMVFKELTKCV